MSDYNMAMQSSPDNVGQLRRKVFLAAKHNKPDVIRDCLASLHSDEVKDVLHHCTRQEDSDFMTPLTIAAWNGHLKVMELLVNDFNMDVDQKVYWHCRTSNALTCAARQGHLDIVKLLVMKGCHLSSPGPDGDTPAYMVCFERHLDVLKYLVENGAEINDRSSTDGRTCLMAACMRGNREIVQYLLSADANPNEQDGSNNTALHLAAQINASAIITLLLKHGACLSRNKAGHSPLIVAAGHKATESVHILLQSTDVSQVERIDALELLGATQAERNIDEAVRHMSQAMEERYKNPEAVLLKPHSPLPSLTNVQESQTLVELQARQADPHLFRLECLAVLSRILGPADDFTMRSFHAYYCELRRTGQHREATAVLLHGIPKSVEGCAMETHDYCREFFYNFADMLRKGISGFFPDVEQVMDVIFTEMEKNESLAAYFMCARDAVWLQLLLVALVVARGQEEGKRLQKIAERFVCFDSSSAVLHAALRCLWSRRDKFCGMRVDDLPYDLLVSFLLQCGADVHVRDDKKNTALHVVALHSQRGQEDEGLSDLLRRIARVLVQAGALVGVQNREGKTPLDLAGPALAAELRELYPVSLKSLAASAVVNSKIPYATEVPKDLKEFIDKH